MPNKRTPELAIPPELEQRLGSVSRETRECFSLHMELVKTWQKTHNLVSGTTLDDLWRRHVLDSLACVPYLPEAGAVVDMGSGAGFPGLVIAACIKSQPERSVHLIESNHKKAAFLKECVRLCDLNTHVHCTRIESALRVLPQSPAVLTSRALAPLDQLCRYAYPLMGANTRCIFHKGRRAVDEIKQAEKNWRFHLRLEKNIVSGESWLVVLEALEPLLEKA